MGFLDKLLGRGKAAADDLASDRSHHGEDMHQERESMADDCAHSPRFQRDAKEQEIVDVEREVDQP